MPSIEWGPDDLQREKTNSGFSSDELHNSDLERGYNLGNLTKGLIAYYPFDDDSDDGTTAIDSAQSHDGQINGAVHDTSTVAVGDTAMSFDGTDDYISPLNDIPITGKTSYTISCWFNVNNLSSRNGLVSGTAGTAEEVFFFTENDGRLTTQHNDSSDLNQVSSSTLNTGQWYHGVMVFNGSQIILYLDGDTIASTSANSVTTSVDTWGMGASDWNDTIKYHCDGNLDDVRIYNRALSQPEIQALYDLTKSSGSIVDDDPRENFVSYWKLDGDAIDSVGSNDGTVNGATFVDGFYNQCASFDGTDDYISTPYGADFGTGDFSFSCWINLQDDSNNYESFASTYDGSVGLIFGLYTTDIRAYASGDEISSSEFSFNEWHHYAAIRDDGELKLYMNGVQVGSTSSTSDVNSSENLEFGRRPTNNQHAKGEIDDVRIYDRALTPLEVQQLYEYGKRKIPTESNL